jgi:hypothetical protein
MNRLIIEPLGLKVNKSGQLYAAFPTNGPNRWDHLHLNHCFLAQVVQCLAWLGYVFVVSSYLVKPFVVSAQQKNVPKVRHAMCSFKAWTKLLLQICLYILAHCESTNQKPGTKRTIAMQNLEPSNCCSNKSCIRRVEGRGGALPTQPSI